VVSGWCIPGLGWIIVVRLGPGMEAARRAEAGDEQHTDGDHPGNPRHGSILSFRVRCFRQGLGGEGGVVVAAGAVLGVLAAGVETAGWPVGVPAGAMPGIPAAGVDVAGWPVPFEPGAGGPV
jgi:hypothetical protein